MLTRAPFTRSALRLFHSAIPRPQQRAQVQEQPEVQQDDPASQSPENLAMGSIIEAVERSPSSHKGAVVSHVETQSPADIFDGWKVNSFYAPLAFLRSRRIVPPTKRKDSPTVGPGAVEALENDVFRQFDIDPVKEANNQLLLSDFISVMGRIQPRAQTGLSWRSQRKITQAIKRSREKGVLPIMSKPKYKNHGTK